MESPAAPKHKRKFRFVTGNDPEYFKDKKIVRENRSFVMFQQSKRLCAGNTSRKAQPQRVEKPTKQPSSSGSNSYILSKPEVTVTEHPVTPEPSSDDVLLQQDENRWKHTMTESQPSTGVTSLSAPTESEDLPLHTAIATYLSPFYALLQTNAAKEVLAFQRSLPYAKVLFEAAYVGYMSTFPLNSIGSPHDAFGVLPKLKEDCKNTMQELKSHCSVAFACPSLGRSWIPKVTSNSLSFLSTLCVSAAHLDAMREERSAWAPIMTQMIPLLRQMTANKTKSCSDQAIVSVLQVLLGTMISCQDISSNIHWKGLAQLVTLRGGLFQLDPVIGQMISIHSVEDSILSESPIVPEYLEYLRHCQSRTDRNRKVRYSPLYCDQVELIALRRDPSCSHDMYELLCDIYCLTNLIRTVRSDTQSSSAMELELQSVCARIASLPSAFADGSKNLSRRARNAKYRFEASRIAALIYSNAILNRCSFSFAASQITPIFASTVEKGQPSHHDHRTSRQNPSSSASGSRPSTITSHLKRLLSKSDTSDLWGPLSGVLFFVALVGGAAARENLPTPASGGTDSYHIKERSWMSAVSVRCGVILGFEHQGTVERTLVALSDVLQSSNRRGLTAIKSWHASQETDLGTGLHSGNGSIADMSDDAGSEPAFPTPLKHGADVGEMPASNGWPGPADQASLGLVDWSFLSEF